MTSFKKYYHLILIFTISSCHINREILSITRLTLYNTISDEIKMNELSFNKLSQYKAQEFSDPQTINIINHRVSTTNQYLWKGNIFGKILLSNNDSAIIKISRYGAFFKDLSTNKICTFETEDDKLKWQKLINTFLDNN